MTRRPLYAIATGLMLVLPLAPLAWRGDIKPPHTAPTSTTTSSTSTSLPPSIIDAISVTRVPATDAPKRTAAPLRSWTVTVERDGMTRTETVLARTAAEARQLGREGYGS